MKQHVKNYTTFVNEQKNEDCKLRPGSKVAFKIVDDRKVGILTEYLLDGNVRIVDLEGTEHELPYDAIITESFELTDDGFSFDEPADLSQEDMDYYFAQLVKKYKISGVYRGGIGSKYEFPIEAKDELDSLGIDWYTVEEVTNNQHPEFGRKYIDVTYKLPANFKA